MYLTPREEKQQIGIRILVVFIIFVVMLVIGTFGFHFLEGWSYVDSLYFSSTSLTRLGNASLRPSNWVSVIFNAFYLIIGLGVILYIISSLVTYYAQFYQQKVEKKVQTIVHRIKNGKPQAQQPKWVALKNKYDKESKF